MEHVETSYTELTEYSSNGSGRRGSETYESLDRLEGQQQRQGTGAKRKRNLWIGLVLVGVVVASVVIGLILSHNAPDIVPNNNGGDSSPVVEEDNSKSKGVYERLKQKASKSNVVALDATAVDPQIGAALMTTIGTDALVVSHVDVQLTEPDEDGRRKVVVSGISEIFSQKVDLLVHCNFNNGTLILKSIAAVQGDSPVPLKSVAPAFPSGYDEYSVRNLTYELSSSSKNAQLRLRASMLTAEGKRSDRRLQLINSLSSSSSPHSTGKEQSGEQGPVVCFVSGILKPSVQLSVSTADGLSFSLGKYVTITNVTIEFAPSAKTYGIAAVITITPPNVDSLVLSANGSSDFQTDNFTLAAQQIGSWSLPAGSAIKGLELSRAAATITVTYNNNNVKSSSPSPSPSPSTINMTQVTGMVQAQVSFGDKIKGFAKFAVPPVVTSTPGYVPWALETVFGAEFDLWALPAISSVQNQLPAVSTISAAMVLTSGEGLYQFGNEFYNMALPVVKGCNMAVMLNLNRSSSVFRDSLFRFATTENIQVNSTTVLLIGDVSVDGNFDFSADLSSFPVASDVMFDGGSLAVHSNPTATQSYVEMTANLTVDFPNSTDDGSSGMVLRPITFSTIANVRRNSIDFRGVLSTDIEWGLGIANQSVALDQVVLRLTASDCQLLLNGSLPSGCQAIMPRFSGFLQASVDLDTIPFVLTFQYPYRSHGNMSCFLVELQEITAFTFYQLMSKIIPGVIDGTDFSATSAPDSVVSTIMNTTLENVVLSVSPNCGNISGRATLQSHTFGSCTIGFSVFKDEDSGAWHFSVYFQPGPDFQISSSDLVTAGFPKILFGGINFILATGNASVILPVQLPGSDTNVTISTDKGLTVFGLLELGQQNQQDGSVASSLRFVEYLQSSSAVGVALLGEWDAQGLSMSATLEQSAPYRIAKDVNISKAVVILSDEKGLSVVVGIDVQSPFNNSDVIALDLCGQLKPTSVNLTGDATDAGYTVDVVFVDKYLSVERVHAALLLNWNEQQLVASQGDLLGELLVGPDGGGHLAISLDLLLDKGVVFNATLDERPPIPFSSLIGQFIGDQTLSSLGLSGSALGGSNWEFDSLALTAASDPVSLNGSGSITAFGLSNLGAVVSLFHSSPDVTGDEWGFSVGVDISIGSGASYSFSSIFPSVTVLDNFAFASMAVALASRSDQITLPAMSIPFQLERGFNFFAGLSINGLNDSNILQAVRRWTGIEEAAVYGTIESLDTFVLHADLQGNLRLFNVIDVTAVGIQFDVSAENVAVGIESAVSITVPKIFVPGQSDTLNFTGDFLVADVGLQLDVAMTDDWNRPFGIPGFSIQHCALSIGISYELVPYLVGVGGGLTVAGVSGHADVYISDDAEVLYASIASIDLRSLCDALLADVGISTPPHLLQVLTDLSLGSLSFYLNAGAAPVTFDQQVFPVGFMASIQDFNLWDELKGSASMTITSSDLVVNATLDPISLLGGKIVLSGARSPTDPLVFVLGIGSSHPLPLVDLSGGLTLFTERVAAQLLISDSQQELYIDMSLFDELLNFTLDAYSQGSLSSPTDFGINCTINNELQNYIEEEVPKRFNTSKAQWDSELSNLQQELLSHFNNYTNLQSKIANKQAADQAALSDAQKRVQNAQAAVVNAQQKVQSLQDKIDYYEQEIHNLKWYDKWKAVGYGVAIAGLETAKVVAEGALDAAQGILSLAQHALEAAGEVAPDIDPEVLFWEAEVATEKAAYTAASNVIRGVTKVLNLLNSLVDEVATWQGKVFNIEQLTIGGSLSTVSTGGNAQVHVQGMLMSRHVDITVDVDIHLVEAFVEGIWKGLVDALK